MKPAKKKRPCLRCDRPFITTPETRICSTCKRHPSEAGAWGGLEIIMSCAQATPLQAKSLTEPVAIAGA